jgi:hypothetical protein
VLVRLTEYQHEVLKRVAAERGESLSAAVARLIHIAGRGLSPPEMPLSAADLQRVASEWPCSVCGSKRTAFAGQNATGVWATCAEHEGAKPGKPRKARPKRRGSKPQ